MGVHAALVVHPDSGRGAAARVAGSVAEIIRGAVDRLDLFVVETVEQSRELMTKARGEGLDVVVVLGGDGAAHQAVQFCAGTKVALGIVPAGTGNDLARALNIHADPLRAAADVAGALREGTRRRFDLGRVWQSWFSTVLCAGFDAAVTARANRMRWPSGPRRYDLAILAELAAFRPKPIRLRTDTERLEMDAILVAVGNTAWYGGGIPICPGAQPDDGLLDVTVIGRVSKPKLVRMLPSLRTGKHIGHPAIQTFRTRRVVIEGERWPVFADGEPLGESPIGIECVRSALTIVAR